jgi:hypothetical protein
MGCWLTNDPIHGLSLEVFFDRSRPTHSTFTIVAYSPFLILVTKTWDLVEKFRLEPSGAIEELIIKTNTL